MVIVNDKYLVRYNSVPVASSNLKRRRSNNMTVDEKLPFKRNTLNEDIFKGRPIVAAALLGAWKQEELKIYKENGLTDETYVTLCAPKENIKPSPIRSVQASNTLPAGNAPRQFEISKNISKDGSPAPHKSIIRSVKSAANKPSRILESPVFRRMRKHYKSDSRRNSTESNSDVSRTDISGEHDVYVELKCEERVQPKQMETKQESTSKRNSLTNWIKRRSSLGALKKSKESKVSVSLNSSISTLNEETNKTLPCCNSQIEDVLKNHDERNLFRNFLKKEFSDENLEFWVECENYKTLCPLEQVKEATRIFEKFIQSGAPFEINIDCPTRTFIAADVLDPSRDMFNEAQQQIFRLMKQDSFPRFMTSLQA